MLVLVLLSLGLSRKAAGFYDCEVAPFAFAMEDTLQRAQKSTYKIKKYIGKGNAVLNEKGR